VKPTWLEPEVERGVVLEVLLDDEPFDVDHVASCRSPLLCALACGSNAVAVIGVSHPDESGCVVPATFHGIVTRVRVSDGRWLALTSTPGGQDAELEEES
jgi:hypothetical protein